MSYTRRQWAIDFLHALGNPAPNEATIDFVAGWTAMETSAGGGASYNLLNTEQQAAGSWNFNSAGVQNYPTYSEGVETNAHVLENGLYGPLLQALATNDTTALGLNGQPPSSGVQRSLTNWVKGPGYAQIDGSYVNGVVSLAHSSSVPGQTFPGSPGSVSTASPPAGGGSSSSSGGGGFSPQVRTDQGYTTSTTTTSSPPPNPIANFPILGGIYQAGLNTGQALNTAAGIPQAIGDAEQNLVSTAAKVFQSLLLVVVAVVLVVVGLVLLFKPEAEAAAGAAGDQVQAARERPLKAARAVGVEAAGAT